MEEIAYNSGPEKAKVQSVLLFTDGLASGGMEIKDRILAEIMQIQNPQGERFTQQVLVSNEVIKVPFKFNGLV